MQKRTSRRQSDRPDTELHDAVKGRTVKLRGMMPGGTSTMRRLYDASNAKARRGGYAR